MTQTTHYYPYGGTLTHSTNQGVQKFKYNGKEFDRTHGLDRYDYSARQYDPASGRFTSMDPLCEKYYNISPYSYCAGNPIRYVDPDGKEPTPSEALRMAMHVYGNNLIELIGGWDVSHALSGKELQMLTSNNGLSSQLYERTINGVTEYVYATAGSENTKDWIQNIAQPLGLSNEYHESARVATMLSEKFSQNELTFVGHSQGGSEAALNSLLTSSNDKPGRKAITFNASGLSAATKIREGGLSLPFKSENKIDAYIFALDPLNSIQNNNSTGIGSLMPDVNGNRHYIIPKTFTKENFNPIYNHGVQNLLNYF
ncbi:MAG: RHS repeat-associated core domain-containing protein [Bacteroidaceae bacterium]|nr:RHS repeat-associated core domain-containing protein [Bacteroidaceae bacterium]